MNTTKVAEYYNEGMLSHHQIDCLSTDQMADANEPHEETLVALDFPPLSHQSSSSSASRRTQEEEIYEDLCYVTLRLGRERQAITLEPVEKRDYCIKELIETEKNYIDALNMIINHFVNPLKKVLSQEDHKIIFMNIKQLADVHAKFYADLRRACGQSPSPMSSVFLSHQKVTISSCFLTWKDKFVIYGDYCSELPKAQCLIDDICVKDDLVNEFVTRCQMKANEGKFKLRDLLSLPMQRILKYHLLLSELIKSTQDNHEDYSGLNFCVIYYLVNLNNQSL